MILQNIYILVRISIGMSVVNNCQHKQLETPRLSSKNFVNNIVLPKCSENTFLRRKIMTVFMF